MCGRITFAKIDTAEIYRELGLDGFMFDEAELAPRYNVGPGQKHPIARVVDGKRQLEWGMWGWMRVVGPPRKPGGKPRRKLVINSVSETAMEKPMFSSALTERRCVLPADGWYEWIKPGKKKLPIHFSRRDAGLLVMAGLYTDTPSGPEFVVLTTPPSPLVAKYHDRMPLLIDPSRVDDWLESPDPSLMVPAADDHIVARPANVWVNKIGNDAPVCLVPVEERQPRQLQLL